MRSLEAAGWTMDEQQIGEGDAPPAAGVPERIANVGELLRSYRKARRLRQLDLGREVFLDHSTISRLEGGERLPTLAELHRLANALRLSGDDRERLQAAFERATHEHFGIKSDVLLHSDEVLYIAQEQLADARQLRLIGKPQLGAVMAGRTATWLRMMSRRSSRRVTQEAMLRALGNVLVEQCKSQLDYLMPSEAGDILSRSLDEQEQIVRYLSDRRLELLRRMNCEGVRYLTGDHDAAHRLSRTFAGQSHLDLSWQPELLRAASINAGYVADTDGLRDVERSIERAAVERDDLNDIERAFMLEGLARGQAAAGDSRAVETIDRAGELIEGAKASSDYSAFRWVQVVRTKMRAFQILSLRPSREVEGAATEAVATSERLGYLRHGKEIASLLDAATG